MSGSAGTKPVRRLPIPAFVAILGLLTACGRPISKIALDPVDATGAPVQTSLAKPSSFHLRAGGVDWTVTRKASYRVSGIVLGTKRYRYGWSADLAPMDVALAWGDLVRSGLYRSVSWSQSDRWYWWRYGPDFHRGNGFIIAHSSNNHLIPCTRNIGRAMRRIDSGDAIQLEGYLVFVDGRKGDRSFHWHSSLSRTDQGNGSCEIIYLKRLTIGDSLYE